MAIIKAQATGNWSATGTWSGGVVPGPGDDAYSNTYTVTIDVDTTCASINNGIGTGITAGGGFVLPAGVTLTGNVNGQFNSTTVPCLLFSANTPNQGYVVGNVASITGASGMRSIQITGTGKLNIVGNVQAGGNSSYAIEMLSACALEITGNVQSSTTGNAQAIFYGTGTTAATSVTINGAVISPGTGGAANVMQGINGTTITVNGAVYAGVGNGLANAGSNAVTIVNGPIYASASKVGVLATGSGCEVRTTGPLYNALGSGMKSMMAVFCESVVFTPTAGLAWRFYEDDHTTPVNLYFEGGLPNLPDEADVRAGVVYGSGGAQTGTLEVPPATAVASGVPVDDTVGLAVITPQAVADAIGPLLEAFGP